MREWMTHTVANTEGSFRVQASGGYGSRLPPPAPSSSGLQGIRRGAPLIFRLNVAKEAYARIAKQRQGARDNS